MKILILPSARDDLADGFDFRLLSKRFPYAAYYDIDVQTIRIWAVLDCRQAPESIRRRLAKLGK